jgi:hypothetical protein
LWKGNGMKKAKLEQPQIEREKCRGEKLKRGQRKEERTFGEYSYMGSSRVSK